MAKVFYGNQYVGSLNIDGSKPVKVTRMERFVYKAKRFIKRTMIVMAIFSVWSWTGYGFYALGGHTNPRIVEAEKLVNKSDEMYQLKIAELQDSVVMKLRACESGGAKDPEGLIVFDSNKVASIGSLQFQVKTVIHYYKTLYGKDITNKEAINIATNDSLAIPLAKDIMFKSKNLANDWFNCSKKLGLESEIKIIKSIM